MALMLGVNGILIIRYSRKGRCTCALLLDACDFWQVPRCLCDR